ncbi:MAG: UPF0058 family protein [Thermoplasmatota archaeon]
MHKDELLQLHSLLCQMKRFFQESGVETDAVFADYEDLEVSPQHIHKSKTDHKRAVFLLSKGFSELVLQEDMEHCARLKERFSRLAGQKVTPATKVEPAAANLQRNDHLPAFALAALQSA